MKEKVTYVFFFDCRYRANWTAIDPGAAHAYVELAVEAGIARQPCSGTYLPVQHHDFCTSCGLIAITHSDAFHYSRGRRPELDVLGPHRRASTESTKEVRKRPTCVHLLRYSHDYAHVVGVE